MIVVNLEKYAEENYYKQPANSPGAASPDNITHARLYYDDFAGSNYLQGSFVSNNNSTVQFDNSAISDSVFKLFTSTDGVTYTERKSYGGSAGADEFSSAMVLDPADYEDYDVPTKITVSGVEQFLPKTLNEIVDGAGLSMNDYYFVRGKLFQDNTVYSGAPFFGAMLVNPETGALIGGSSSYHQNTTNSIVVTACNYIRRSTSAKVTTGVYYLQCMVGATTGTAVNGFINTIDGTANKYKWENSVFPVYGSRTVGLVEPEIYGETYVPGLVGYVVLDVNDDVLTYYGTGKLLIKTYNTSWVLADNILTYGCTLTFKALKINQ